MLILESASKFSQLERGRVGDFLLTSLMSMSVPLKRKAHVHVHVIDCSVCDWISTFQVPSKLRVYPLISLSFCSSFSLAHSFSLSFSGVDLPEQVVVLYRWRKNSRWKGGNAVEREKGRT